MIKLPVYQEINNTPEWDVASDRWQNRESTKKGSKTK